MEKGVSSTENCQIREEDGAESIPLTDVYKRGFTKIYAKYLRLDEEKAVADFNTHHSVRAVRRPLDAGADLDETAEPTTAVAGLSLNRDTTIWLVFGVAALGLVLWALFSS